MNQNLFNGNFFMPQPPPQHRPVRGQQHGYFGMGVWPVVEKPSGSIRHKFTKAEDELLKSLVEKYGESNWVAVSAQMKTRSPRQCRERYKNYLSPKIKNGPWTPEEEELLVQKVKELGQRWANIALFFEPRSDVNVKNHWTAMMNRQARERNAMLKKNFAGMLPDKNFNFNQNQRVLNPQQQFFLAQQQMAAAAAVAAQFNQNYSMAMMQQNQQMPMQAQQMQPPPPPPIPAQQIIPTPPQQQQQQQMQFPIPQATQINPPQNTNNNTMNTQTIPNQPHQFVTPNININISNSNNDQPQNVNTEENLIVEEHTNSEQTNQYQPMQQPPQNHSPADSTPTDADSPIFNPFAKKSTSNEWFDQDLPDMFQDKDLFDPKDDYFVWE